MTASQPAPLSYRYLMIHGDSRPVHTLHTALEWSEPVFKVPVNVSNGCFARSSSGTSSPSAASANHEPLSCARPSPKYAFNVLGARSTHTAEADGPTDKPGLAAGREVSPGLDDAAGTGVAGPPGLSRPASVGMSNPVTRIDMTARKVKPTVSFVFLLMPDTYPFPYLMKDTPSPNEANWATLMVSVTTAIQPVPDWLIRMDPSSFTASTTATCP